MKKCCRCKEGKQDIYFCKNKNTKDGLHVHCKECEKNRQKEWRLKNPDLWQKQKDRNLIKYREKYSIELTRPRKINKRAKAILHPMVIITIEGKNGRGIHVQINTEEF